MLESYRRSAAERAEQGIPPLPLDAVQTSELCELLKNPPPGEAETLVELLRDRAIILLRFLLPPAADF